ncbi:hypothetical protein [Chryseobacterium sp. JV274]|uniref:hypothetical protein n=1 Tax=Chryseobacterium sp. JV274 TaxID=1932669 RepID=UPI0015C25360|nr:hypothetical protein [Chryseobacterium sp. JV274]CAD0220384.1 protein of unknown function [Chryseobacterium sp. JV274]
MKRYRFKITSRNNNSVLGTGAFTSSKEMNPTEQIDFFHQYTNGRYLNQENFVIIEIGEEKPD